MKLDLLDPKVIVAIPLIALTCSVFLTYQFVYLPKKTEAEQFYAKYPPKCIVERNQTVILIDANEKMTLNHPQKVCQVLLQEEPDDNNTLHYYVNYQYESQAKYNKTHDVYSLNCKPKNFDSLTGNFICTNGIVAKEKWVYEQ